MSTDLIHFRRYALDELGDRFKKVEVVSTSLKEIRGHFCYTLTVFIDGQLCVGTGLSQGKAVASALSCLADHQEDYERVTL